MKRFVVIVTSLLIIFVFIALNYLLWDRESLVTARESNQASIDVLGRINMNLNEDKDRLERQIEELNSQVREQEEKIGTMEEELQVLRAEQSDKTQFILDLKTKIDTVPLQTATVEWVNALAEKDYPLAYIKNGSTCSFWGEIWSLKVFSDFFGENIQSIELILRGEQNQPVMEVIPSQTTDWEIKAYVHVNVKPVEGSKQQYLSEGINILEVAYTYSERIGQWVIASVSSEAVETKEPEEDGKAGSDSEED